MQACPLPAPPRPPQKKGRKKVEYTNTKKINQTETEVNIIWGLSDGQNFARWTLMVLENW